MAWQQVYNLEVIFSNTPVAIPYKFASDEIIVQINSIRAYGEGVFIGWIWQVVDVPNVGISKGKPNRVYLTRQSFRVNRLGFYQYTLEFKPLGFASYLTLKFWEDNSKRVDEAGNSEADSSQNKPSTSSDANWNETTIMEGFY